jgi:hypothetical protein
MTTPNNERTRPRVYADFNNADTKGRLRLICKGTLDDLQRQSLELAENMKLSLYMEDIECIGTVVYSKEEEIWVAVIDWNAIEDRDAI